VSAPPTPLSRDRLFIMIFNSSHARRSESSYSLGLFQEFQILLPNAYRFLAAGQGVAFRPDHCRHQSSHFA
jgi:hypothetical protein